MSVVVIQNSSAVRRGARASVRSLLAASVALGAGLALSLLGAGAAGAAGSGVPYSDPNAVGSIGLCDAQGQQITGGSIETAPFAWRAVSTTAATGAYAGTTRTAILYAYQPIKGLAADDWSGAQLTSSSRYTNPANPMAAATGGDNSLAAYMRDFAPQWDGYLQLRIYLGAANEQPYSVHYPTLDVQVTGTTWHAVDSVPVNCNSGTSESIESILLPASDLQPPSTPGSAGAANASGTTSGGAASNAGAAAGHAPHHPAATTPAQPSGGALAASGRSPSASGADHAWLYAAGAALVVALGLIFGVFVPRRRRRRGRRADVAPTGPPTGPPPASDSEPEHRTLAVTSTKGISS